MGGGTLTAGLLSGGNNPSGTLSATEKYDGTSWTTSAASLNTARVLGTGGGTQTAGIVAFGTPPTTTATEEFTAEGTPSIETIDVT